MEHRGRCRLVNVQQAKLQQAGLTGLGLFAVLVVLLFSRLPSVLPDYPAVIVAFAAWCVLPGWFLQRALFATKSTGFRLLPHHRNGRNRYAKPTCYPAATGGRR